TSSFPRAGRSPHRCRPNFRASPICWKARGPSGSTGTAPGLLNSSFPARERGSRSRTRPPGPGSCSWQAGRTERFPCSTGRTWISSRENDEGSSHNGECLHLQDVARPEQCGNLHRGTRRRTVGGHVTVPDLSDHGEDRDVRGEHPELDNVCERGPGRRESQPEILEDPLALVSRIAGTYELASVVHRDLASDRDHPTGRHHRGAVPVARRHTSRLEVVLDPRVRFRHRFSFHVSKSAGGGLGHLGGTAALTPLG